MRNGEAAELERAWAWRERRGWIGPGGALRVFHGPGEGSGGLRGLAVDRFGDHYWVTRWEGRSSPADRDEVEAFLRSKGAVSAVWIERPEKGIPQEPAILLGSPPAERFEVREAEGERFWIRLTGVRHPGLFLDHRPLRSWLRGNSRGARVLNTFAYTGSLSVSAGLGGASHVTTLDLSKPSVRWAEDNWVLNGLSPESARFIAGDVFEWLPRLGRERSLFDLVILDPPSFSRGKKGSFSTSKDLERLHAMAFSVLAPGGTLVTSINSANVAWKKYEADVARAAASRGLKLSVLERIGLPETFPTRPEREEDRYLKGWILRAGR